MCEKKAPPDGKTLGSISLKSTKSGGGEQFLLLDCRATARRKGMLFFTATGVSYVDTLMAYV